MATTSEHRSSLLKVIQQPEIQQLLDEKRRTLSEAEGISFQSINLQLQRPVEHMFTAQERPTTTMLFGGFTFRHEYLIKCHFENLGYKTAVIPTPNTDAFQAGKEYGNNGQCNPTYFTVGNLVQYLEHLRDEKGLSVDEIIRDYFFITAGSCGPCRFGMYEAEYRLALRNAGFDGFRVMLFQQKGGLKQGDVEAGLQLNPDFFLGLVNCINMGDLLNEFTNQLRPYEIRPGQTDEVLAQALNLEQTVKVPPPVHDPHDFDAVVGNSVDKQIRAADQIAKPRADVVPRRAHLGIVWEVICRFIKPVEHAVCRGEIVFGNMVPDID